MYSFQGVLLVQENRKESCLTYYIYKTPKRRQNHGSCSATMLSLLGSMHVAWLNFQEELETAARDVECTTLEPKKLLSSRGIAAKPGIVLHMYCALNRC